MVAFAEHREVRVTPRISVTMPFVAPDMAPISTHNIEIHKGERDWTDYEIECPDLRGDHLPRGHAKRVLEAYNVGDTVLRRPLGSAKVRKSRYVNTGPSAARRAMAR